MKKLILKHEMDVDLTLSVYEECKHSIEMKQCYNNIFNVLTRSYNKFSSGEWRVAYGYVLVVQNIMARHCFIVTKDNTIVDPTLVTTSSFDKYKDKYYISFKIFELQEYLDAIERNDRQPSFYGVYREEEMKANEWALENGMVLGG